VREGGGGRKSVPGGVRLIKDKYDPSFLLYSFTIKMLNYSTG